MKTEKRTVTVEKEVWVCADPKHYHQSAKVAQACIDKHESRSKRPSPKWTVERQEEVLAWHAAGMSLKDIGARCGVRRDHIAQRIQHWKHKKRARDELAALKRKTHTPEELLRLHLNFLDLPTMVQCSLMSDDVYRVGDLVQCTEDRLRKIPNLGKKSIAGIKTALSLIGLSLTPDKPRRAYQYPSVVPEDVAPEKSEAAVVITFDAVDEEDIDVLRGPQGTLYERKAKSDAAKRLARARRTS